MQRQKISERNISIRKQDFEEVVLGYFEDEAVNEAKRCLNCKNPRCKIGCPVGIDIPDFLTAISNRDFKKAFEIIKSKNPFPGITGRICPQETQCEGACVLKVKCSEIAIGNLERFVADWALVNDIKLEQKPRERASHRKIAIIGSGPAGLACAGECVKLGYPVTIFEALHAIGGVLRFGIPKFRLPRKILDQEIDFLKNLGVKFVVNTLVGKTLTFDDLKNDGFEAFFVASGAGTPFFLNIPNENLKNIYSANEFLTRINLMSANLFPQYDTPINLGKKAVVVGGGNVAMDSARTLVRIGLEEVYVVYRRTKDEMPARQIEILHAEEEGVKFLFLTDPIDFLGDELGNLKGIKLQKMRLSEEKDAKNRRKVEKITSDFEMLEVDMAVIAIGQDVNPVIAKSFGLELDEKQHIVVDPETMETSQKGVFAGGDITTGAATVISAMGAGKKAAFYIDKMFELQT